MLDDDGSELIGRHRIRYDYLVIAVGSVTNDFDTPGVLEHCLVLDERTQADRFRQKLLNHCLRVSRAVAAEPECDAYVDVAIVGGGATGVELAAELYNAAAALRYYGLEVFEEKCLRVTLIEAGPRILPALPEKLAEAAHHELEALGVNVLANTSISRVSEDGLWAQSGDFFPAHLKVWAAGVKGAEFLKKLDGLETNARNQLLVRPTLQTSRDDRIFALGDCCACTLDDGAGQVPPRAQAAHQMATTVFRNLRNLVNDRPLKSFAYRDHGSLVSLSRFSTVGSLMGNLVGGRMAIEGRLAKFVYSSLYRMHLIAIHGWIKGGFLLLVGRVNKVVRPRMKLH